MAGFGVCLRGGAPRSPGRRRGAGRRCLIAASFCLANRYVDGLGAITPDDPDLYDDAGKLLANEGYLRL